MSHITLKNAVPFFHIMDRLAFPKPGLVVSTTVGSDQLVYILICKRLFSADTIVAITGKMVGRGVHSLRIAQLLHQEPVRFRRLGYGRFWTDNFSTKLVIGAGV